MLLEQPIDYVKKVEEYESRMFEYFSQCSAQLREWFENGGKGSESYESEYNRVSDEYQQYLSYIKQLREFIEKPSEKLETSVSTRESVAADLAVPINLDSKLSLITQPPLPICNSITMVSSYTQYYRELIRYFETILNVLAESENDIQMADTAEEPLSTNIDEFDYEDETDAMPEVEEQDLCADPRAVMKQYFKRYGETGKWDWASWNNYLSWIARSNPQWYAIFLEYSQSLGIDWDQMYNLWKMSNPNSNPSFSDEFGTFVDPGFIKPPTLNQSVYHGLLFGKTDESQEDDDGDELYCRTCNHRFPTNRAFSIHLRGVTHIQRALEGLQRVNPERLDRHALYPPQESDESRHYAWLQSQYMEKCKSEFVLPGSLYCQLCQVQSSSYAALQAHLSGRRHRDNVTILQSKDSNVPVTLKDKRPVKSKSLARLQTLLDVCTQPLIGLNYLVERQFGEGEECTYYCELCYQPTTRQDAIDHVCGVQHRTSYMKAHYPDMCGIIVSDKSSQAIRLKRIEFYARKIEDFEGRKRVRIKQFSSLDGSSRIWRPQHIRMKNPPPTQKKIVNHVTRPISKKKSVKTRRKPVSEDLEEGEITEDSSDEEANVTANVEETGSDALGEAVSSNSQLTADEVQVPIEALIPRSVLSFRPTADCQTYIDTLKSTGSLSLDEQTPLSEATVPPDNPDHIFVEQFEREAQWVLDRVREKQMNEAEQHRQYALSLSEAVNSQPAEPSLDEEHSMQVQPGKDVLEERLHNAEPEIEIDKSSTSKSEEPAQKSTVSKENDSSDISESALLGLLGTIDPKHQSSAMSNGAVEILLSALGALKEAGQLPTSVLSNIEKPVAKTEAVCSATTTSSAADSTPISSTVSSPKTKPARRTILQTPPSSVADSKIPVDSSQQPSTKPPIRIKPVQFTIRSKPPASKVLLSKTPVSLDLGSPDSPDEDSIKENINHPNPSNRVTATNNHIQNSKKREFSGESPARLPSKSSQPAMQQNVSPTVGTLPVSPSKAKHSETFPFIRSELYERKEFPPHPEQERPVLSPPKFPHVIESENGDRDYRIHPPNMIPFNLPPAIRFESYMQADANSPQDPIFDAYALYSRRSGERARPRGPPPQPMPPPLRGRPIRQPLPGRKLSVIADMLGVNEPPAPPSFPAAVNPELKAELPSNIQPSESNFFHSVTASSHISYYIPKGHPSLSSVRPGGPFIVPSAHLSMRFSHDPLAHQLHLAKSDSSRHVQGPGPLR